jgi:hypothetical protein
MKLMVSLKRSPRVLVPNKNHLVLERENVTVPPIYFPIPRVFSLRVVSGCVLLIRGRVVWQRKVRLHFNVHHSRYCVGKQTKQSCYDGKLMDENAKPSMLSNALIPAFRMNSGIQIESRTPLIRQTFPFVWSTLSAMALKGP